MPIVKPGGKVLVSGANGYVACWVVQILLEKGYSVRGTVRSESKGKYMKERFGDYVRQGKFDIAVVEDITKEGAFDEAVKGVDAIEHVASPVVITADDPQEVISPAVNGTLGILKSAAKLAPSVKRIVITSSAAAVITLQDEVRHFTEEDWNDQAVKLVEEQGRNAEGFHKYRASKTLAERGAWDFWKENKQSLSFDITTFTPPWILGPGIQEITTPETLNASLVDWYKIVVQGADPTKAIRPHGAWIDVRDLALEHVLALEQENAGGERFVSANGNWVWQDWMDIANSLNPSPIPSHPNLPKGTPGSGKDFVHVVNFVTKKEESVFKIKKRSAEETTRDLLEDFEKRGW